MPDLVESKTNVESLLQRWRVRHAGPVFVTDRGRPSFVLVSFEEWTLLAGRGLSIAEALTGSAGAAVIEFDPTPDRSLAVPAEFD